MRHGVSCGQRKLHAYGCVPNRQPIRQRQLDCCVHVHRTGHDKRGSAQLDSQCPTHKGANLGFTGCRHLKLCTRDLQGRPPPEPCKLSHEHALKNGLTESAWGMSCVQYAPIFECGAIRTCRISRAGSSLWRHVDITLESRGPRPCTRPVHCATHIAMWLTNTRPRSSSFARTPLCSPSQIRISLPRPSLSLVLPPGQPDNSTVASAASSQVQH